MDPELLIEIEKAVSAGLFRLAIQAALALPDMCSALEAPDGKTDKGRYAQWVDKNLPAKYREYLTGADCYGLRCSVLHQGRFEPHSPNLPGLIDYDRVLFALGGGGHLVSIRGNYRSVTNRDGTSQREALPDVLMLRVENFCTDVVGAVRAWVPTVENEVTFKKNAEQFMRAQSGWSNLIAGVVLIA